MEPTIKDVAQRAKVSTATVSRVLNGQHWVAEQTKAAVLQAVQELNYKPNAVARSLMNAQTKTLAILFPNVSDMFSGTVLSGIEDAAHERGFSVIVCKTGGGHDRTLSYLQLLAEKRVDGIIFASEVLREEYSSFVQQVRIPLVVLSGESVQPEIPTIRCNDHQAAYAATSYLIGQGHEHIGMLYGGAHETPEQNGRLTGFHEAHRDHGLVVVPEHVLCLEGFAFKDGQAGGARLLHQAKGLTAIFASSDELALGVMSAAYARGIQVPSDLSVMGFDDLPLAEMSIPPLTTVRQPLYGMGRRAATMLLDHIQDIKKLEGHAVFPTTIIERKSVRRL
ncbi:substrate-binding domain-containing protein [Deinococcus deserti]|uniref:Putative transcriptional regulator, HTH-type transcriptional repressor purR, LacI family n=1 Tax=Deinococcus deserti (strain DSM 17065 / CIP 109153 / LMG 22923 / VCD115) TaxID=546414 RepID=C1D354_DEIDV|nr:substrate-binding domain-containing protein [Deinococcus deserti]ACO47843.1 putative transcriptional regulator, HTH-type transcriptional repressor purR, LacI family [Deinococcus deserti VCD115]